MLKHTCMQVSNKPVVQACHDFKIFMHTSKGEQVNFKFLVIQFRLMRYNCVKHSYDRFKKFHNSFIWLTYLEQSPSCTKQTVVCTDNAQKNYLW